VPQQAPSVVAEYLQSLFAIELVPGSDYYMTERTNEDLEI
jgi:hypothetical protein